jgi:hypothetical protein
MRVSSWQSPQPLNHVYRGESRTHDSATITASLLVNINRFAAALLSSNYGARMSDLNTRALQALVVDHHDIDFARACRAH